MGLHAISQTCQAVLNLGLLPVLLTLLENSLPWVLQICLLAVTLQLDVASLVKPLLTCLKACFYLITLFLLAP